MFKDFKDFILILKDFGKLHQFCSKFDSDFLCLFKSDRFALKTTNSNSPFPSSHPFSITANPATVHNPLRAVEKKNKALNEISKLTVDLSKEIKEFVKIAKKSKDKVKDMKNALPV